MNRIVIRPLQPRHVDAAATIKRDAVIEIWAPHVPLVARQFRWNGNRLRHHGLNQHGAFGAFVNSSSGSEKPIGVVRVEGRRVSDLWVNAAWRGRGVGTALLDCAERQLAHAGIRVALLRTAAFAEVAIQFYHRCGWRIRQLRRHETTHHRIVVFTKRIR